MDKTAVQWLIDEYFGGIENCTPMFRDKIKEAIQMEEDNAVKYGAFLVNLDRRNLPLIKYLQFLEL